MRTNLITLAIVATLGPQLWAEPKLDVSSFMVSVNLTDGATGACWTGVRDIRHYIEEKLQEIGSTYLPIAQSNISIWTDEFTCVVETVHPDEQAAEAGLKGMAEWRDHHPETLEIAEDNFYLEGFLTNFM